MFTTDLIDNYNTGQFLSSWQKSKEQQEMKTDWKIIRINKEEKKKRERKQFYLSTAAKSATENKRQG